MKPTLIIDADDTLWKAEVYYQQCIVDFGELMVAHGFDRQEAEQTLDLVEIERIPVTGYSPHAFAENLALAYRRLCQQHGRPAQREVEDQAQEIGQAVVAHPIELLPDVRETLGQLGDRFHLLLLTKGDRQVQRQKLTQSGLADLFDGVHIVAEKDADVFRDLIATYELHPERTWMVGNSPKSDINPALEAGIGAIHIPQPVTWSLEQEEIADPERVVVLDGFGALVGLFANRAAMKEGKEHASLGNDT